MKLAELFKQYLEHLFAGKRCEARELILAAQDRGTCARSLLSSIIWPAMTQVEKLYREGHISRIVEHMAMRINRMIADQLHLFLARRPKNGQRMVIVSGTGETEELGAQMTADMFEAEGWSVWFLGGGVPNDEVLQFLGKLRPDILTIYGTEPSNVPEIRRLIAYIREIGACDEMQILISGGIFDRAEGLAEEVRADLYAPTIKDAVELVAENPSRVAKPHVPEPGRRRKRKKKSQIAEIQRAESLFNSGQLAAEVLSESETEDVSG